MITTTLVEQLEQLQELNTYPAVLNQDISYPKNGEIITVKQGTQVLIDLDLDVALIGQDHVDILEEERTILFS